MLRKSIIFVAILCITANSVQLQHDGVGTSDSVDQNSFDFGLFQVKTDYNETMFEDRLRTRKATLKLAILNNSFKEKSPFYNHKITIMEELIRCGNQTLLDEYVEARLDCQPIESYIFEKGRASAESTRNKSETFVKRYAIKGKSRSMLTNIKRIRNMTAYRLNQAIVEDTVRVTLSKHNIAANPLYPNDRTLQEGYYIEVRPDLSLHIVCRGQLIVVTDYRLDKIDLNEQSKISNNNVMIILKDFVCTSEDSLFNLYFDLEFIKQNKFPYISCKNTISVGLDNDKNLFWTYRGHVEQSRDVSSDPIEAYNTTIRIDSQSSFFKDLVFHLDQKFVNNDFNSGFEEMIFAHPYLSALVNGSWTADSLFKSLQLFDGLKTFDELIPRATVSLELKPEEVALAIRVRRDVPKWAGDEMAVRLAGQMDMLRHIEL